MEAISNLYTFIPVGDVDLFVSTFEFYQQLQIYSHTHILAKVLYKLNSKYLDCGLLGGDAV
jgi:hypothetical protein